MIYVYEKQRQNLFTDEGQRMFLRVRDWVGLRLNDAGAFRMQEAMSAAGGGDSWDMLACVDRLVELGEIREVTRGACAGQHRVFVAKGGAE